MKVNNFADAIGALLTVALVTTLVAHKQTAAVASAIGDAGSSLVSAALGKGVTFN